MYNFDLQFSQQLYMCVIKWREIMCNLSDEYSNISVTPVSRNMRHGQSQQPTLLKI